MKLMNAAMALTLALVSRSAASGTAIPFGTFQQFAYTTPGAPATGCSPADPAGLLCVPSAGTLTQFAGPAPWTFTAPTGGAALVVTDAFAAGDRFEAFDFGVSLGMTSAPAGAGDCGDDPRVCLITPGMSWRAFILNAGDHSIEIKPVLSPNSVGSAYLMVSTIPEPAAWLLWVSGLAGLRATRRRPRPI